MTHHTSPAAATDDFRRIAATDPRQGSDPIMTTYHLTRPDLDELLASMGEAGERIVAIDAAEASAGNISVCVAWDLAVTERFPITEQIELPAPAPALAGRWILCTGSGRRLRQLGRDPEAGIGVVLVHADGSTGTLHTSPRRRFDHLTSEFNSHLGVHQDQVARRGIELHAVLHAQPPYLTYLSHIPAYRDDALMNAAIMRWEPETVVALPGGIRVLEFMVPGSTEMMAANVAGLRDANITLWSQHGVMARSDRSVLHALDRIEYAETGAKYEYLDIVAGHCAEGLTRDQLTRVSRTFSVESRWTEEA